MQDGLLGGYQRRRTIPVQHRPDWHIYPLAGISANDIGDWSCGINLGGGADFSITRNWDVSAGFKWMIQTAKDYVPGFVKRRNPIVINIGATYRV